jgi:hypothetical protein
MNVLVMLSATCVDLSLALKRFHQEVEFMISAERWTALKNMSLQQA